MSKLQTNGVSLESRISSVDCRPALSQNQSLIWLGQQLQPDTPLHEMVHVFTIDGNIDENIFVKAFRNIVNETDVLRFVSPSQNNSTEEIDIQPRCVRDCEFIDLSNQTATDDALDHFISQRKPQHLDLKKALYDSALIRLANNKYCWYMKIHHVITDALNGQALLTGLEEHYLALKEERASEISYQYQQYLEHEEFVQSQPDFNEHQNWWKERSDDYSGSRFYRSNISPEETRYDRVVVNLNKDLSNRINQVVQTPPFQQVTPSLGIFNLFMTSLMTFLYRLEDCSEICIGTMSHGRTNQLFRKTIGLFMQMLPMKTDISSDETFATLSKKIASETIGFFKHAVPGVSQPATQKSFDVALNFVDFKVSEFAGFPAKMDWFQSGYGDPSRRLTISVVQPQDEDYFQLIFDFNRGAFDENEQSRATSHFCAVLEKVIESPDTKISDFILLADEEKEFLAKHLGAPHQRKPQNIWERFVSAANEYPDRIALYENSKAITYSELMVFCLELAEQIELAECGPIVPLLCRREGNAIIGMLGALASGRCFMPIDTEFPAARIQTLLDDSGAKYAIDTQNQMAFQPLEYDESIDCTLAQNAAYILYTSGSTGKPNGVFVGHDSLISLLEGYELLAPAKLNRCSWWTNVNFDVGLMELFSALLFGRSLYVPNEKVRNHADLLFEWFCEHKIENGYVPPFFLEEFNELLKANRNSSLKRLLVGVEQIPQNLLASIAASVPNLKIINGYGPTEATIFPTLMLIDPSDHSKSSASIGRPVIENLGCIVDSNINPVPPGVPGELLLGGACLAFGYHNNPELTATRFIHSEKNPQSKTWYRTGDKVRQRADGCIEFLGRIDDQLKINGHRVEPNEVAHNIRNFEGILDSLVVPVKDKRSTSLIAFYISQSKIDVEDLKSYLSSFLPRYLIPSKFIEQESFIRKPNGKVDVKAVLKAAADKIKMRSNEKVAPQSPLEFTLVSIWQEILQTTEFGVEDSFFELGGDSLDVMKVVRKSELVGIQLSPSDVFENQTVKNLADFLEDDSKIRSNVSSLSCTVSNDESSNVHQNSAINLSAGQIQLWSLSRLFPESPAYNIQVRLDVSGKLDEELFIECFEKIVRRHDALRTNYILESGKPKAVLRAENFIELYSEDIQTVSTNEQQENISSRFRTQGRRPFDLSQDSLLRLDLFKLSPTRSQASLTLHHISVDQHSLSIILDDLKRLYQNHKDNQITPLPETSLRSDLNKNKCDRDLEYWKSHLDSCSTILSLPYDQNANEPNSLHGEMLDFTIPKELTSRIQSLASQNKISLNVLLMAAFNVLLHRYSNQDDLLTGVPVSHRPSEVMEQLVGFFVESVPIRSKTDLNESFQEFLLTTNRNFIEALDHLDAPFDEIVKLVGADSNLIQNPLFQAMFVMQEPLQRIELDANVSLTPEIASLGTSKFDLTMFAMKTEESLRFSFEYSTDLFLPASMETLRDCWIELLTSIVKSPSLEIGKLRLLDHGTLTGIAKGDLNLIGESKNFAIQSVHKLIEDQSDRTPNAVAISFEETSITYQVLNDRANKLCTMLQAKGVSKGDCVTVCLERSVEMIVAILGVLKAGAAYVPISTTQPQERVQQILDDCGASFGILHSALAEKFTTFRGTLITLDGIQSLPKENLEGNLSPVDSDLESLAYLLYTSGSTGKPKGVEVTHQNLFLSTMGRADYYKKSPESFLLLSSFAFDSSIAGIFWTLCTGGKLVLPSVNMEQNIPALANLIAKEEITHSLCLPSLYELLLNYAPAEKLSSMRQMIVAGESCSTRVVKKHFTKLPSVELHNEYGPTEATVWSTVHKLSKENRNVVPIGSPAPHSEIFILDQRQQPVPTGWTGEICIGGPKLAKGYRNQPELTSQSFISNPLLNDPNSRLYRTGDLGIQLPDGNYIFLGRIDNQIKVNGHRVECEEIESAISSHPNVKEVVVGNSRIDSSNHSIASDVDSLITALSELPNAEAETLLSEVEAILTSETDQAEFEISHEDKGVKVSFEFPSENSIETPRSSQRAWMLNQALREATDDLNHLKDIAPQFVPGSDNHHVPHDISSCKLTEQEIMEDWQYPLMDAMAQFATESHGDILEIGFGRGVSANLIQNYGVRSHTIVESNPHSISDHFIPWKEKRANKNIQMIEGRWQDVLNQFTEYDSVFFHAFPLNEREFVDYIANSVTFAEHFFPTAAKLLRPGGVFTYLTTEIDSLSRRHQRSLFQHFSEIRTRIQPINVPDDTKDAWWTNSMVVIQATVEK